MLIDRHKANSFFFFATVQITTDSALRVSNYCLSFEFHNTQLPFLHTAVFSSSL